jgi:3-phenylpropionate/cinnamic acid dioxygenase small subunit
MAACWNCAERVPARAEKRRGQVMQDEDGTTDGPGFSCADRAAIGDLLIDYCRHLDRMDLAALAGLFTADCQVTYGPDPKLSASGRTALEASLARMWRWSRTAHHLSNLRIWPGAEGTALAESYVHAWHERPDGATATIFGRYLDKLVRTPQGWRIEERRMEMNGADAGFRVAIPQAPRHAPPAGWVAPAGLDGPQPGAAVADG